MDGESGLAQKYKAMAILEYMRSKGKVPNIGTTKQRTPDANPPEKPEAADEGTPAEGGEAAAAKEKSNVVTAAPAYKNVRLTQAEENELYLELADFLLEKSFCTLSKQCLQYVADKDSVRVLFANTKSKMLLL